METTRKFTGSCCPSPLSLAKNFPLETAIVHLADRISHQVVLDPDRDAEKYSYEKDAWDAVQLSEGSYLQQIIEQTEAQLEEVSQIFLQTV